MYSNILKGRLCADPKAQGRYGHIPQIKWRCPPEFTMDPNWGVAAGENSTEVLIKRRVPSDPRPCAALARAGDRLDSETPLIRLIPIEEENLQAANSTPPPFLITTAAMSGETTSLVKDAVAALNDCAARQGDQTRFDIDSFIHLLNNSDIVQSSMLNKATQSAPSSVSSNPDHTIDNCARVNTGVVISKPDDWTPSDSIKDVLDLELLAHVLYHPEDIEKLKKLCDASDRSVNPSSSMMMKAGAADSKSGQASSSRSDGALPSAKRMKLGLEKEVAMQK